MSSLLSDWPLGLHSGLSSAPSNFYLPPTSTSNCKQSVWLTPSRKNTSAYLTPSRRASLNSSAGHSQLARHRAHRNWHMLCVSRLPGSAGESVSGQVPGFFPKFFRTGIWVPGITRLWDQRLETRALPLINGKSGGGVIWNCQGISYFTHYPGHVPRGNGSNVKGTKCWGQNFSLFLFQGHFSSSISSIFSSPFPLLWFRSSLLPVWTLRIVFWCVLYLQSVTPIPICSLMIAEGSPWRFNGNHERKQL